MFKGLDRRQLVRRAVGASAAALAAGQADLGAALGARGTARQLEGTRITVVGREITIPTLLELSQEWMQETGITVEPVVVSGDLGRKILQSAVTGAHLADVHLHDANIGADLYARGYYLEVPGEVKEAVAWDDIFPFQRDRLSAWQGTTYGIPYDGDNMFNTFRRDLMLDPANQEQFAAAYGYEMDPETGPKTWQEHDQYAEFFTGRPWGADGQDGYGFASMFKRGGGLFWAYVSRAAAYAKHPDVPDFYFRLDTGEPLINTEPFVRALTEWKAAMEAYAPPGAINTQWPENVDQLLAGRVAMTNYWADVGKDAQNTENSVVKGRLGFHFTPGSTEVYNQQDGAWETLPDISYAPFLGFGGRNFAVSRTTQHAEACWEFVRHACSPEMTLQVSVTPGSGMDPVRQSQLDVDAWVNSPFQMEREEAERYLGAIEANLASPNLVPDLRLPGWAQYQDALETAVSLALSGGSEPQAALDQAANQWRGVTEQLGGAEKQMGYYRDLLGV